MVGKLKATWLFVSILIILQHRIDESNLIYDSSANEMLTYSEGFHSVLMP